LGADSAASPRGAPDGAKEQDMTEWLEWSGVDAIADLTAESLVDVMFEDAAAYETLPCAEVPWDRRLNPVVMWRPHAPDTPGGLKHSFR
jgi:hypothetical protein